MLVLMFCRRSKIVTDFFTIKLQFYLTVTFLPCFSILALLLDGYHGNIAIENFYYLFQLVTICLHYNI